MKAAWRKARPARAWWLVLPALAALAAALSCVSTPAAAQQAEAQAPLEPVIVTGTHAPDRTELTSTAPVDILSADDLRAVAGPEASLGQALQALLPSFNYLDQSNSGSADHVRAGQLRGLNPDQILVLIDGKRVHPTSIVNVESTVGLGAVAVDFNSIPVNAIKRVEVLRDGAGAQYGSDAIAGVINVILDDSRNAGGELQVNTGLYHTHFAPTNRVINDGQTVNLQGKYGLAMDNGGFVHFGLDATHHDPTNRAGFDQFNPTPDLVTFQVGDAKFENLNLWANSSVPLAGSATGYSVLLFNRRNSYGDAFFREPTDLVNNDPAVYPNGFLPQSTGRNEDWHLSAGMRGNLAGPWNYDGSLTYGLNRFAYGLRDSLNSSFGTQSPTSFNLGGFRFTQASANYDVSGQVGWLGLATPSTFAYGAEFRRETYGTTAGDPDSYLTGTEYSSGVGGSQGDAGLRPSEVSQTSRNVAGIYADLSGDIIPSVFADAGARFDHYTAVGSATTGRLSARWQFVPNWALRGALSNNFRAPALAQISSAYSPTAYVNGGGLGTVYIVPVSNPAAQSLGAQPLRPERSKNYSLGLTAQPLAPLQITADVFRININDRIALSQELTPTTGPYAGETFQFFTNAVDTTTHGAEVVGSWNQKLGGGVLRLSDASMWTTNAIRDIHAAPPQVGGLPNPTSAGLLFGLQAQNAITTAVPKRRDVVSANWSGGGAAHSWDLLARVTHSGQVTRVFDFGSGDTPTQTYGATVQLDLEAEYHATRDLALALGTINLTDRYPTMSNAAIAYGGNLPYDFLSPIGFNGRYLYARARYELH
ncbi:MAG TPA: TonB-dependent receptor [Burkholderiaceae bacterium]|nr:TonB-dependent receptor [Burkholderiaceae bacterium]